MNDIDELLTRGVANIIPAKNELAGKLRANKKLNIYLGIDPTATKIHLGHAVPLKKLNKFAKLGHNVTFLIGDFTALIGDTSDKDSERPALTSNEIAENFKTYKKQAEKVVDFSKIKVKFNSLWLKKLNFKDILNLMQKFSLNDFISRELISKRLKEGKRIRLDEVAYPLMQGYDSYFLDTDLQIGGTDQTFNMQAGRSLQKNLRGKDSFILSTSFLEGTDGRKMSKSWGNAIWLDDNPKDIFAKAMAVADKFIINYFTLATDLPLNEIKEYEKRLKTGENPINIKKVLAYKIVKELYSEGEAKNAQLEFEKIVQKKELPQKIESLKINLTDGPIAIDVFVNLKLVPSRSEFKRLIEQKGITIDDEILTDPNTKIKTGQVIRIGKRKIFKLKN